MWWLALCPATTSPAAAAEADALLPWALQFTPRVARRDEAVLLEVQASLRLFGGAAALRQRIEREAAELGAARWAWAGTGLGALALARAGAPHQRRPLAARLDPLPLPALLGADHPDLPTLAHIGCRTLGELRALPRDGLARRFGADVLQRLDEAYGLRAESYRWVQPAETFAARLELAARVEAAPALLLAARRLLLQLAGWLAARQLGVTAFTLSWAGEAGEAPGALSVHTAAPSRDVEFLARLLGERLAQVRLAAPVDRLQLRADTVQPYVPPNAALLPDAQQQREQAQQVIERIAARLGAQRVLRPLLQEDARPERQQRWLPANAPLPRSAALSDDAPHPAYLLDPPRPLPLRGGQPTYQGEVLALLLGPHRVEAADWLPAGQAAHAPPVAAGGDPDARASGAAAPAAADAPASESLAAVLPIDRRDYWLARSASAGLLWIFRAPPEGEPARWYLHGVFA